MYEKCLCSLTYSHPLLLTCFYFFLQHFDSYTGRNIKTLLCTCKTASSSVRLRLSMWKARRKHTSPTWTRFRWPFECRISVNESFCPPSPTTGVALSFQRRRFWMIFWRIASTPAAILSLVCLLFDVDFITLLLQSIRYYHSCYYELKLLYIKL